MIKKNDIVKYALRIGYNLFVNQKDRDKIYDAFINNSIVSVKGMKETFRIMRFTNSLIHNKRLKKSFEIEIELVTCNPLLDTAHLSNTSSSVIVFPNPTDF